MQVLKLSMRFPTLSGNVHYLQSVWTLLVFKEKSQTRQAGRIARTNAMLNKLLLKTLSKFEKIQESIQFHCSCIREFISGFVVHFQEHISYIQCLYHRFFLYNIIERSDVKRNQLVILFIIISLSSVFDWFDLKLGVFYFWNKKIGI